MDGSTSYHGGAEKPRAPQNSGRSGEAASALSLLSAVRKLPPLPRARYQGTSGSSAKEGVEKLRKISKPRGFLCVAMHTHRLYLFMLNFGEIFRDLRLCFEDCGDYAGSSRSYTALDYQYFPTTQSAVGLLSP